jgi:parallel beta-helix repeat protein
VAVSNSTNTTITGNLISGNSVQGIELLLGDTGTLIESNEIGTDAQGDFALSNGSDGIEMYGALNTTIGGTVQGAGNLISGNLQNGIDLTTDKGVYTTGTLIEGNIIGLNAAGNQALVGIHYPTVYGIFLVDANDTTIGGTTEST